MEKSNIKKIIIAITIIIIILGIIYLILLNMNNSQNELQDYTPAEEISEEQVRQTMVTLYFKNKETKTLMPEARIIDVKELAKNPYSTLINMLLKEPKSEKLESAIPIGTTLEKVELKGDVVYVDLSIEFINNQSKNAEEQSLAIYSIVNTLTELTEVGGVKILIEGKEDESFPDSGINLQEIFIRKE